jgi:transketolase
MSLSTELANAIRALSMDAVQKAKSGHPGAPMGMADIAQVLWGHYLQHNPANPGWADRDRFVLSNGHGSMLLYSVLHLTGYDLSLDDIKNFRQLDSRTAGHPEYGHAPGIETTTGPLGQGLANAVGMAIAEKVLAAQFNRDSLNIVDHNTWVFLGDGCLMEGISHEVCSLAGTLGLGKLIAFYDDNGISIDGEVDGWFTDDTPGRFEAYGWHVIPNVDGHDPEQIIAAIEMAKSMGDRPTIICCKTVIGYGSPNKQGKESCHGAPLGDDEIVLAREQLGWSHGPFEIPDHVYAGWDAREKGADAEARWQQLFENYRKSYPELAAEYERRVAGELPVDWESVSQAYIKRLQKEGAVIASRKASQNCLNVYGPLLPELLGGSADLAGSNLTFWSESRAVSAQDATGNYLYFGVREFGMTAIVNGIALHGGFIAYGATFLIFVEYARNAMRMAALMKLQNIQVYTHDSIGLGEDGPTHQPIEQLASLRMTPNMSVWRPCDTVESAVAWKVAIESRDNPSALVFSRQNLMHMDRTDEQLESIAKGGYVLRPFADGVKDALLLATGSEVGLAMDAAEQLMARGRNVSVVSMPCVDSFLAQDKAYRESVLPGEVRRRVAVEAGIKDYWYKFTGLDGAVVGMDSFGGSAPGGELFKRFGFTVENVVATVEGLFD